MTRPNQRAVYYSIPEVVYQAHGNLGPDFGWASVGDWTHDLDQAIDAAIDCEEWRIWRIDVTDGRPAHIQDITDDAREYRNEWLVARGRDPLEAA